jgi:OOP family OmpA-OmpF porin
MHQPSRWWWGLIPVAALWIAADFSKTADVEADLAPRAGTALAAAVPDAASAMNVTVSGRDVLIEGPEFAPNQGDRMSEAAAEVSGVRLANGRFSQLPTANPFAFRAMRADKQFVLAGSVPNPAVRAAVLNAARAAASGGAVVDNLEYAAGAPAAFEQIAIRGLTEAAKLEGGSFSLLDTAYSIAGAAASSEIYEAAVAATRELPAGAALAKADIQPPEAKPFAWFATSDGATLTMLGAAPSIDARSAIASSAASRLAGKAVVNRMQIARGAPAGDFVGYANYALGELGRLTKGRVVISDDTYSIEGEAPSAAAYEEAVAATGRLPAGLKLARADITAPVIRPYRWDAGFDGNGVTLSGLAPSVAVRADIAKEAAQLFPGKTIANKIGIARGAPDGDFAKATASVLTELAKLSEGRASLTDAQVSISGTGPAGISSAAVRSSLAASLPSPFAVATVDIKEAAIKPYVFRLQKGDGHVRLSGYVPDEDARRALVAAATTDFFADNVEDELKIGAGAPADLVNALKAIFPALARLWSVTLTSQDTTMTIDGLAIYAKGADKIRTALASAIPGEFKIDTVTLGIRPPEPTLPVAECQPAFDGLLAKGRIRFQAGSAELSKESLALLDHLIDVAQRCSTAEIEVAGHTDSMGAAAENLELSKRRAQAVVDYLREAGVDTSRISSVGYGQTKPVVSNDTDEGRAQNRRIEFVVK